MKTGKLSNADLNDIVLKKLPACSSSVTEGPGTGLDCGIMKCKGKMIAVSSDPVTGAGNHIGKIALHVSCNDIASCGVRPSAVNLVIIIPPSSSEDDLASIVDEIAVTARDLEVDIIGGHTEVSDAVTRPVLIATAFGYAESGEIIYSNGAKSGDSIVMTKYAAIEGTSIIASDFRSILTGSLSEEDLDFAAGLSDQLSVLREGTICAGSGIVNAMHDVTEGGVLGAAKEMAEASGLGCRIDLRTVKLYPQTKAICEHFQIDPYRLISSGSMLVSTPEPDKLILRLESAGITCSAIGIMVEKGFEFIGLDGELNELTVTEADELYKIR